MKTKKIRVPRKLKKQIPLGHYCYIPVKESIEKYIKGETGSYKVKLCPFYQYIYGDSLFGCCTLLKTDEIIDQCKSCGIKCGY